MSKAHDGSKYIVVLCQNTQSLVNIYSFRNSVTVSAYMNITYINHDESANSVLTTGGRHIWHIRPWEYIAESGAVYLLS